MSLTGNWKNFNEIERQIQKKCNELGCSLLKAALENWDAELCAERDRAEYRHKGKRKTVIKTLMGEVEYERTVYETRNAGIKSCVYLLDEAMGKHGSGFMSALLSEQIAKASCESSYRGAARSVSEMTGQTISHTAAWNVVQSLGERLDKEEIRASKSEGGGTLETKLLFEEQDGIWLHLQGKSRKLHGKNREMKLSIAYDGAKKAGKKRYELTNKVACANFESAGKFVKRKEGVISKVYNVNEIEMRFLNGDGAEWIKNSITDDTVHFQLDPFHRNKAVLTYVTDPEARANIMELLYSKQTSLLLQVIEAYANSTEDEIQRGNYISLLTYYSNNREGLVPCHRRGLTLPEPPEGKVYRRLGAMESNVFTILGNRMKGRRACWSISGGNNLARLLCLKFTGRLSGALQALTAILPEKHSEKLPVIMSAKVPLREGKGYNGFHNAASFPATPDYKWLRGIGAPRSLAEN